MHRHQWTPWEFNGQVHEYFLDGFFVKNKYEHVSECTVCHKPRVRKFRTVYGVI